MNARNGRPGSTRAPRAPHLVAAFAAALAGCGSDGSSDADGGASGGGGNDGGASGGEPSTGTGGSIARMTIARDFLYAISGRDEFGGDDEVQLFDISTPTVPVPFTRVRLERGLETLFPYSPPEGGDYLLVGAEAGVYVLDNTDVGNPQFVGTFEHARAEDPVVAQDGYAYVTLRDAGFGVEGANTLSIVDARDLTNPTLVRRLPMQGPRGLSIGDDRLYVCDGRAGIKVYDIPTPGELVFADLEPGVDCLDVIAFDGRLHVITEDALLQYDAMGEELVLLSRLGVDPEGDAAFARGPTPLN